METSLGFQHALVAFCCIREKSSSVLITEQTIKMLFEKWTRVRLVAIFQHHPATKAFVEFDDARAFRALLHHFSVPRQTLLGSLTLVESLKQRVVPKQSFKKSDGDLLEPIERHPALCPSHSDHTGFDSQPQSSERTNGATSGPLDLDHPSKESLLKASKPNGQTSKNSGQFTISSAAVNQFKQMLPPDKVEMIQTPYFNPSVDLFEEHSELTCLIRFDALNCAVVTCHALVNLVGQFAMPRAALVDKADWRAWVELASPENAMAIFRGLNGLKLFSHRLHLTVELNTRLSLPTDLTTLSRHMEVWISGAETHVFSQEHGVVSPTRALRLSNLSDNCSPVVLLSLMSQINEPVLMRHVWRQGVAGSHVFFTEFASSSQAAEVLAVLNGKKIDGRPLRVVFVAESRNLCSLTNV